MPVYTIRHSPALHGEAQINTSKNAVLPILAAALLCSCSARVSVQRYPAELPRAESPAATPTPEPMPTFTEEQKAYGSAALLTDATVLVNVFLNDAAHGQTWDAESRAAAVQRTQLAVDWIAEQAAGYEAAVDLICDRSADGSDSTLTRSYLLQSAMQGGENSEESSAFLDEMDTLCASLAADSRLAALDRDARKTLFAHEAAVADGVAAVGERRAVVRLGGAVRRQLDRHRRDGERTDDGLAEGVVGGHVRAVRTLHTVGLIFVPLGAHVGQTGVGRELHDQPVAFRQRSGMRGLVVQQLFAVILSASGRRGDDDSVRALRDGELAGDLGDIVVLLAEGRARRIGDGIFDRAVGHISHAAGGRDAGHLAGYEAVTRDGDIRTGQRRAVVFLARGLGRERHGARQNGQLAVHTVGKGVVARNVCAAAHDLIALDDVLSLVAHVRGAALNNSRQHVAGHQHTFGAAEAAVRERRSVVLFAAARRGDGDGLFGDGGDGESAVHNGEHDVRKVLARIREVAGDDAHRVLAYVHALCRPRRGLRFGDVLLHVVERVVGRHGLIAGDGVLLPVIHGGAGLLGSTSAYLAGMKGYLDEIKLVDIKEKLSPEQQAELDAEEDFINNLV